MEYRLHDKVSIRGRTGWIRGKSYTCPPQYEVQLERELLKKVTADRLTLVERHEVANDNVIVDEA